MPQTQTQQQAAPTGAADEQGRPVAPQRRRARQGLIAAAIAGLAPLVLTTLFLLPTHDPKPNGFPIGIAGGGHAAARLAGELPADGFDVHRYADAAQLRRAIRDREAYGGVAVAGPRATAAYDASAASKQAAMTVQQVAARAKAPPPRDLVPLDPDDPQGTSLNQLVLPLVFTSTFLGLAGIALLPSVGVRARVAVAALGAAIAGLAVIAVARDVTSVLPGPWLAEAGVFALGVLAMCLPAGGLMRIIGLRALGMAFLFFTVLGNPGSGLASAPELLPSPWQPLGQFLPPGAIGSAARGTAYFDGARVLGPILVLIAWALLGVVLIAIGERRRQRGEAIELAF
jgi:hypothetical protein